MDAYEIVLAALASLSGAAITAAAAIWIAMDKIAEAYIDGWEDWDKWDGGDAEPVDISDRLEPYTTGTRQIIGRVDPDTAHY